MLLGLLLSRLLNVPARAPYTDVVRKLAQGISNESVAHMLENYETWFYSQFEPVPEPLPERGDSRIH